MFLLDIKVAFLCDATCVCSLRYQICLPFLIISCVLSFKHQICLPSVMSPVFFFRHKMLSYLCDDTYAYVCSFETFFLMPHTATNFYSTARTLP